ncbi:MAG: flagellar protein FlaG [Desulfobacterales bacterium]|nr:flagellar protein FlaG [Desulfobacterales bacterium]MCP4159607.1 flagellar protein FlaG [Deltaproteobacteria bacterium]
MEAVNNHSGIKEIKAAVTRSEKVSVKTETQSAKRNYDNVVNERMLDQLSYRLKTAHDVDLKFSKHEESGETLVKVVDKNTDKVIRQIPSEDFLKFSSNMDKMIGVLFDETA